MTHGDLTRAAARRTASAAGRRRPHDISPTAPPTPATGARHALHRRTGTIVEIIEGIWANRDRNRSIRCLVKRLQRIDKETAGEARRILAVPGMPEGDLPAEARGEGGPVRRSPGRRRMFGQAREEARCGRPMQEGRSRVERKPVPTG